MRAGYRRRPPPRKPPPPPRKPPPPPRDPILEKPRLLLPRELDPLNPLEPPPKALRSPPPLRERSWAPIRSAPPGPLPLNPELSGRPPRFPLPLRLGKAATRRRLAGEVPALTSNLLPGACLALGQRITARTAAEPVRGRAVAIGSAAPMCRIMRQGHRRPAVEKVGYHLLHRVPPTPPGHQRLRHLRHRLRHQLRRLHRLRRLHQLHRDYRRRFGLRRCSYCD